MHQARHGGVAVLAARIAHFPRSRPGFFDARDDLAANRAIFIGRINEIEEEGCDGQRQLGIGQLSAGIFLRGEGRHQAMELFQAGDAVFQLPLPTVPLPVRNVAPKPASGRMEFLQFVQLRCFGSASALHH